MNWCGRGPNTVAWPTWRRTTPSACGTTSRRNWLTFAVIRNCWPRSLRKPSYRSACDALVPQSSIIALAVARADGIPDLVHKRCEAMVQPNANGHIVVRAPAGKITAVLFGDLRGRPERAPFNDSIHPAYQLGNPGLIDGMRAEDTGPGLRRLVVHWASARPERDTKS